MQTAFWESTRWLRPGQLLALSDEDGHLAFVEVIFRDNALLAASRWRGWVGVRFAAARDAETAIQHVSAASHAPETAHDAQTGDWQQRPTIRTGSAAIQAADGFPIGQTVLEALKADKFLNPPFARELFCGQRSGAGVAIDPPSVHNSPAAEAFLQGRLAMFDGPQREAYDHALRRRTALIQGPPGALTSALFVLTPVYAFLPLNTSALNHLSALAYALVSRSSAASS